MNSLNLDSIRSAFKNIPLPSFATTWKGRHVTLVALGGLCIIAAAVAFLFKRAVHRPKPPSEDSFSTPVRKTETPRTPSSFVKHHLPFETPARTDERRTTLQTPRSLRDPEIALDFPAIEDVLQNSHIPTSRSPVEITAGQFHINTNEPLAEGSLSLNHLFTEDSLIYVADNTTNSTQLLKTLQSQGWDETAYPRIISFLSQLDNVGKQGIKTLYPHVSIESELLTHGPIHCSISKKDGATVVVINNLLYSKGELTYQLYLIAEIKEKDVEVNVFCTKWAQEISHPLVFKPDMKGLSVFSPMLCTSPEGSVCIDFDLLTHFKFPAGELSENERLNTVFNQDELKKACGDLLGLEQLNRLIETIVLNDLPEDLRLTVAQEPTSPRISKRGSKIFAHLFLQTDDARLFEISCSLSIESEFRFFRKNKFLSATVDGGFHAEWMKTTDGEHPLVTQFKDKSAMSHVYD